MNYNSMKKYSDSVENVLKKYESFGSVIPPSFRKTIPHIFDFSKKNKKLIKIDLNDEKKFIKYIKDDIKQNGHIFGMGGYGENRIIYRRSALFKNDDNPRSIHLGVDLWMPKNTPIYCPMPAIVHSFQDNNNFGDYGPTIILKHTLNKIIFYTLYGHLSRTSLKKLKVGMKIKKGQRIATLGGYNENGQWPSHLHFQIISDLLNKKGDFPGVASIPQKKYYLTLCPDPNLILRINRKK